MDSTLSLDMVQIGWAMGLMAIAIGLSAWQRLGLEWKLALATARTVIQLLMVGYLLEIVFALESPIWVLGTLGVMMTIATLVARNRIGKKIPNLVAWVGGSIFVSTALTLSYTNLIVIHPDPWFNPQIVIPLAGILLGNAMNAAAIAGERFASTLNASQLDIETHLSLGATPWQAIAQYRREAIRAGLIPILNSMMVVGIVTLPGAITGQILGGVNPLQAALYQMLIMFMLAFAVLITALLVTQGIYQTYFNRAAQFTLR